MQNHQKSITIIWSRSTYRVAVIDNRQSVASDRIFLILTFLPSYTVYETINFSSISFPLYLFLFSI